MDLEEGARAAVGLPENGRKSNRGGRASDRPDALGPFS